MGFPPKADFGVFFVAVFGLSASGVTGGGVADFIRETVQTMCHPVGTCRMGAGANSVVDAQLRVRGVAGLRVVDSSIMPSIVSGNTMAATYAIAEKGADMIREAARN